MRSLSANGNCRKVYVFLLKGYVDIVILAQRKNDIVKLNILIPQERYLYLIIAGLET